MPYIGKSPTGSGVRQRYHFTATGGETSLSGADDNSKTLKFTDGEYVDVYLNGILLVQGTDYGVGTANTISSLAALAANDIVEVVVYDIYNVAKINSEAVRARHYYTATGGETSIGTSQISGLSFAANAEIDVSLNGISLVAGTDYNTTTANTVGGLSALSAGNVIEIVIYEKFQLADTVSKASGGTFNGGVTFTSEATFNGGIGNLIRVQTFTSSGTYTKSSGATKALVYVVGGGGGGGGVNGQGAGFTGVGGGGGAGGMAIKLITSGLGATESVTVGSGGGGGAGSSGASGSQAGSSSFGSHCSATGGNGGGGQTALSPSNTAIRIGGNGGVGSDGDINTKGQPGQPGIAGGTGTTESIGGAGGMSIFGGGARGIQGDANGEDCVDLTQAGSGGGGACNTNTSGNYAGGDGANGIVVVYEYL